MDYIKGVKCSFVSDFFNVLFLKIIHFAKNNYNPFHCYKILCRINILSYIGL